MSEPSAVAHHKAVGAEAKRLVLVVDDDKIFRHMTCVIIRAQGFETVEAENGLDGLRQLDQCQPDLVLCDIEMPIMSGLEFVEEAAREYPSLPMIVISSTDQMSVVAKALRFGIKDFLTKPISNPQHLAEAVDEALKHNDQGHESGDFASEWFGLSSDGELPDEKELHWHLKQLDGDPALANQLLQALNPANSSRQGEWECRFQLMQNTDHAPLIYDYVWLMNGQWLVYAVDTESAQTHGLATALMIRAMVNDHIRKHHGRVDNLFDLVKEINNAISQISYVDPIDAFFGLANCPAAQFYSVNFGLPMANADSDKGGLEQLGSRALKRVDHLRNVLPLSEHTQLAFAPDSGARLRFSLSQSISSEIV